MRKLGLFQPLVLAGVLALGFAVAWGVFGLWVAEIAVHVVRSPRPVESLVFFADGTARVAVAEPGSGPIGIRRYRDLEGRPVPPPESDPAHPLLGRELPAALPTRAGTGDVDWEQRLRSFADGRSPATFWYFLTDGRADGTGYFVGYDRDSRALVGYLGTAGFRTEPPPPDEQVPFAGKVSGTGERLLCTLPHRDSTAHPFENVGGRAPRGSISNWDVYVLGRDSKVYHFDLRARTAHVALDGQEVRSAALVPGPHDPVRGTPFRLAVRTGEAVLLLDERGGLLKRYPIPASLRAWDFAFLEFDDGNAVLYGHSPRDRVAPDLAYRICWVAPQGMHRQASVVLPNPHPHQWSILAGGQIPSPLVLAGCVACGRPSVLLDCGVAATYPEALARSLAEAAPALAIAQVVAAVCALLCYRRQRRFGAPGVERLAWPLFVLVLGLPGWIGYRFGRSWPTLEACPACNVPVPRDRLDCVRCAAAFPRPSLRGTEVFAGSGGRVA